MGLEDGIFPNQRSLNDNPNAIEEERRLFYVAVTRAEKRLYLSYARRRQTFGTTTSNPKSRFLVAPGGEQDELFGEGQTVAPPRKKARLADLGSQLEKMERQLEERNVSVSFGRGGKSGDGGNTPSFFPGDTVRHKTFGVGTVAAVRGQGELQTVSVYFPGKGKKTLVAKIAKLEKVT